MEENSMFQNEIQTLEKITIDTVTRIEQLKQIKSSLLDKQLLAGGAFAEPASKVISLDSKANDLLKKYNKLLKELGPAIEWFNVAIYADAKTQRYAYKYCIDILPNRFAHLEKMAKSYASSTHTRLKKEGSRLLFCGINA